MAISDPISADAIESVARQVENELPGLLARGSGGAQQITFDQRAFAIWSLPLDASIQPSFSLSKFATPTGRWHHQIAFDGTVGAFAWSKPSGPDVTDWKLVQLCVSAIANAIEKGIAQIENMPLTADRILRILVVPAYHIHALWLMSPLGDEVLVVDCPSRMSSPFANSLLSESEFQDVLVRTPHIGGIA